MLSILPAEIVLSFCEYLKFEDVENLSWTNRRMMGIVRRNLPQALGQKFSCDLIQIYSGCGGICKENFAIQIHLKDFNNVILLKIPVHIPEPRHKKSFEYAFDAKVATVFKRYLQYCRKDNENHKSQPITEPSWQQYLLKYKSYLGLTDVDVPSIELYRLLSVVDAAKISIHDCEREPFLKLINVLDSVRTKISSASLVCISLVSKFHLLKEDFQYFKSSPFLTNTVRSFELGAPPFVNELLNIPDFQNKEWMLFEMDAEQFNRIHEISIGKIYIKHGEMSLMNFLKNLKDKTSIIEEWRIVNIRCRDENLSLESLGRELHVIYGERIENILEVDSPACAKFKVQLANQRCVLEITKNGNHSNRGGTFDLRIFNMIEWERVDLCT